MFHLVNSERPGMKSATIVVFAFLALLQPGSPRAAAQRPQPSTACFRMKVYKDSERLPSPQSVRLYSASKHWDLAQNDGQFCLPQETTGASKLDLTFRIGPDRFSLYSLPVGRFSGSWNLYFGGKRFAKLHGLPKSAQAAKSCMVEFDDGEPGTGMVISPCRQKDNGAGGPGL